MILLTFSAFLTTLSPMTGKNDFPGSKSTNVDVASESLSRIFGEATISGFRKFRTNWRRSAWKYCAGVVGLMTAE